MPITVYHAITGRPMSEGQTIIMGSDNVNGVCERVRCFEQIERGEQVSGAIAELIRADMDRWKKVARRGWLLIHLVARTQSLFSRPPYFRRA